MPPLNPKPPPPRDQSHEPQAFETDLERHRGSDDDVYGAHGVQPDGADTPFRPGGGTKLTRVGERRRR
jgi:hypothetical protein